MRKYEIMYIVKSSLDKDATAAEVSKLGKILTDNGATITKTDEWGLRDLAYEIKKETKGYYVVVDFEIADDNQKALNEFNRLARLDANVLRFLITKAHETAPAPTKQAAAPETK